jgi:hypothetical protein
VTSRFRIDRDANYDISLFLSCCVVGTAFGRACRHVTGQCGVDAEIDVAAFDCEAPSHEAMLVADVEAKLTGPKGEMA